MVVDVFNGLLLQTDVGGSAARLQVDHGHLGTQHHHAGKDMEARHLLLQRKTVLPAHHYNTEQVRATLQGREGSLLVKVSGVSAHCYKRSISSRSSTLTYTTRRHLANYWLIIKLSARPSPYGNLSSISPILVSKPNPRAILIAETIVVVLFDK